MPTEILDTEGLAERPKTSPWTVRHWRYKKIGPRAAPRSARRVLYRLDDVETWLQRKPTAIPVRQKHTDRK